MAIHSIIAEAPRRRLQIPSTRPAPSTPRGGVSPLRVFFDAPDSSGVAFSGERFVLTGRFDVARKKIRSLLQTEGARVTGSLSKKSRYLVLGRHASEDVVGSRVEEALRLGVEVITEAALCRALGRRTPKPAASATAQLEQARQLESDLQLMRFAAQLPDLVDAQLERHLKQRLNHWRVLAAITSAIDAGCWSEVSARLRTASDSARFTLLALATQDVDPFGLSAPERFRLGVRCLRHVQGSDWRRWLLDRYIAHPSFDAETRAIAASMLIDVALHGPMTAFFIQQRELCRGESEDAVARGEAAKVYDLEGDPTTFEALEAVVQSLRALGLIEEHPVASANHQPRFDLGALPLFGD